MDNKQTPVGIVEEFIAWFRSRGESYAKLPVKFYVDGEPYFTRYGTQCSLRDYLRFKAAAQKCKKDREPWKQKNKKD